MGIKGLWNFIHKDASNAKTQKSIKDFKQGSRFASDGNSWIYRVQMSHGKVIPKIVNSMMKIVHFLEKNGHKIIIVFDGGGIVPEKTKTNAIRKDIRNRADEK